eukprot:5839006-Amphidinium_carterae.1
MSLTAQIVAQPTSTRVLRGIETSKLAYIHFCRCPSAAQSWGGSKLSLRRHRVPPPPLVLWAMWTGSLPI